MVDLDALRLDLAARPPRLTTRGKTEAMELSKNGDFPTRRRKSDFNVANKNVDEESQLKVCCWKVQGLTNEKLSQMILGEFLQQFDILLCNETWTAEGDNFDLDGYLYFGFSRKVKHKHAKRESGDLGVFVKKSLG